MKAYWGRWSIAPCIPILGSTWRWMVSFTHQPNLPPGKCHGYPLDKRLCGPQSQSGWAGKEKNPCLWQELNPSSQTRSPDSKYVNWVSYTNNSASKETVYEFVESWNVVVTLWGPTASWGYLMGKNDRASTTNLFLETWDRARMGGKVSKVTR
jgi:hypothetical protein